MLACTTPNSRLEVTSWEHTFDVGFHYFYVDATQDLLVLLSTDASCPWVISATTLHSS